MNEKQFYVYFMTNKDSTVLYVGVTNNLMRRVFEHREKQVDGFTKKYNCTKLVYYEIFDRIVDAIEREKQIKGGSRKRKIFLLRKRILSGKICMINYRRLLRHRAKLDSSQ